MIDIINVKKTELREYYILFKLFKSSSKKFDFCPVERACNNTPAFGTQIYCEIAFICHDCTVLFLTAGRR